MDMHSLLEAYFRSEQEAAVLATVVDVEGHAYRKAGATMLLMGKGGLEGGVSPGCLEADLNERVEVIVKSGIAQWVEYDMRPADDFSWGEAIGCGGKTRVLLEPVQGDLYKKLVELKEWLDCGRTVRFMRRLGPDGEKVVSYGMQETHGEYPRDLACLINGEEVGSLECVYASKPRLLVFGASDDAIPVVRLAMQNGFRVRVADWREALCTRERFGKAELFIGNLEQVMLRAGLNDKDYVVLMSHSFPRDQEFVKLLLLLRVRYVGIMGSKIRTERLLDGESAPEWFRFPVGVPIGADGAEEIAVSIVAELIGMRRMGMSKRNGWEGAVCEHRGDLSGGGAKQAHGVLQAFDRA